MTAATFDGARILVTGARGFLGRTLVRDLLRLLPPTARITEVHRRAGAAPLPAPHRTVVADLTDVAAYRDALLDADIVIWTATLRSHFTTWARQAQESIAPVREAIAVLRTSPRLRRFIFTSSISAVDRVRGDTQPISDSSVPAPYSPYGRAKLATEELLLTSGLPVTVLRLPFLYGPDPTPNSFVATLRKNATSMGWGAVRWEGRLGLLYTGDFAAICLAVADPANAAAADASPYTLGDGQVYEYDALVDRACALFDFRRPLWRWPASWHEVVKVFPMSAELRYWRHVGFDPHFFVVDASRFRAAFDVRYTPMAEALPRCYGLEPGDVARHPRTQTPSPAPA